MSAIFENANRIRLGHKLNLVMTISQSGRRAAQIKSPYLYTATVEVNQMYDDSDAYFDIGKELRSIGYGLNILKTKIPDWTKNRGSWSGHPRVLGTNTGQTEIYMRGFTPGDYVIRDGDFVQFEGDAKVYQAVGDYQALGDGLLADQETGMELGLNLNTPLYKTVTNDRPITHGVNVEFSFQLEGYSDAVLEPISSERNMAFWDEFAFTEVLI